MTVEWSLEKTLLEARFVVQEELDRAREQVQTDRVEHLEMLRENMCRHSNRLAGIPTTE